MRRRPRRRLVPALVADPRADEIMAGVVAYLDCGANATAAADPETLPGIHLVLWAVQR